MPRRAQILNSSALPFPFLNAILPKMTQPRVIGGANGFRRMRLRHGDQGDLFASAPCLFRGGSDAFLHTQKIFPSDFAVHPRPDKAKLHASMCSVATPNICG